MFDFKRAYRSALEAHPDDPIVALSTPWSEGIDVDQVLQEYPRPLMRRESYLNLNGLWDYAFADADTVGDAAGALGADDLATLRSPDAYQGRILVPFSPEAPASGVGRQLKPNEMLWYRRVFPHPHFDGTTAHSGGESDGGSFRVLLHFEAVDYAMACFVNGLPAGAHEGGYLPFCFDITELLQPGENELTVCVADPSETGTQPRGKQKLDRGTIWYTAQSGIWQTVWMEAVPASHIQSLRIDADPDGECLRIEAQVSAGGESLTLNVSDGANSVIRAAVVVEEADSQASLRVDVLQPHLWSPDDPFLYQIDITYGRDRVSSYCAFRTFSVETDGEGVKRFCLNHRPLFLRGLLDQGYWSDGLLTAPSDEALLFDIRTARQLGFNMLRKHIKIESARWYYHCDRLGMIVWQDMVSGGAIYPDFYVSKLPTLLPRISSLLHDTGGYDRFGSESETYRRAWVRHSGQAMEHLRNHPSIAVWVVFNEGWGQFDAQRVTDLLRKVDATRPFDQTSGWFDQGGGDFSSVHNYFRPLSVPSGKRRRAAVISEFGGLALHTAGHSAIERAYGYQTFESEDDLQAAVEQVLASADALRQSGLSGFVYTQLSDVEEEVNGLVTYDRRVVKIHPPVQPNDVE